MRALRRWPVLVGLLAAATAAAAAPPVVRLEVVADQPVQRGQVLEVLGLSTGASLDHRRLREGVRALYSAGEVEYLRVDEQPEADGVAVTVHLHMTPHIAAVDVTGVGLLWRHRVRGWLDLEAGETFDAAALAAAAARVRRELAERGYADARVTPWADYERADNTVRVTVEIALGEPLRLAAVRVTGIADPDGHYGAAAAVKPGAVLTADLAEHARARVEAAVRSAGFWEAEATATPRAAAGGEEVLDVQVDRGPHFTVRFEVPPGGEEAVRQALPDPVAQELHPEQTGALAETIRDALESAGFLMAQVGVTLEGEGAERTLVVHAEPGARREVRDVAFPGAVNVRAKDLLRAVRVARGDDGVTEAGLDADRQAIAELYRRRGFVAVHVDVPVVQAVDADGARVLFPVDEGPRWVVEDLRVEGLPVEVAAALEAGGGLPLAEGGPWDPRLLDTARRRLEEALADAGYPDARVTADTDTATEGHARVLLRVDPGPFVTVGEVVVAGLDRTRPSVVRGVLARAGVKSGAPYSLAAFLKAQRHLYELGLFRRVELSPIPGQERAVRRGVVVRLEEGAQRSYLVGVGWDTTNGARLTLGWSHLNLFGGAHAVSLETRLSGREKRVQASLREPHTFGLGVPTYAALYRTEEEFASYSQRRRGLWVEVGDRRRRPWREWLRYEYQIVRPDAPDEVLSELERQDREIQVASLTPTLEWDTRDDPFLPKHGHLASLSLEYAFPLLNADARFLKVESSFSLYGRLPQGTGAAGLRIGAIHPIAAGGGGPENLKVPINVRFFAGGRVSQRAFATDRLGVPGQTLDAAGDPVGGNALLLVNLEYRRRIRGSLSGVLFLDGGNVWAEPALVRLGEMRWGVGLGFWLDTPAGPLRLEYGYKLHRRPGESGGELFLSFGTPF